MQAREQHAREAPASRQRVVFEHTVEWLLQPSVRLRLSSAACVALRDVGLDVSSRLRPVYSFDTWRESLAVVAADLYPRASEGEAFQLLGHLLVQGVAHTALGRAMVAMVRLLGPLRSLRRIHETFRSADNYVESRLTELSSTRCELWVNEVMGQPGYYQGILEAGLAMAGAHEVRVEVLARDGAGATYGLTWR
jgi:uncharacterized protein (TIGR02265 family)